MKKQKLVAALMSIALGASTVFSTVAFAEESVLPNNAVEMGTTESNKVTLPEGIDWVNNADKTVYYNGKYYETLAEALDGTNTDTTIQKSEIKKIYCNPNANNETFNVGKLEHKTVSNDLIIYGYGAMVSNGEGKNEHDIFPDASEKDINITVNDLNGIAAWGVGSTQGHTINLEFNNCKNMHKILFRGNVTKSTGAVNITVRDCSFDSDKWGLKDTSIHSLYKGSINVIKTTFNKIDVAINLNNNSKDKQIITVENCKFNDCGLGSDSNKTYAAPIRIVAQDGATSNLTVNNATFTYGEGNTSCNGDILLGDGRALKENEKDKKQGITTLAMENTNANVMVQNYDYYKDDGTIDSGKGETTTVKDTQIVKPNDNNHFEVEDDKPVNPPIYPIYPPTPSEPTKTEIIGSDRYETAAKIADKMGYYDTAILVNGDKSLSDGLSASSLAGKEKAPILLVKQNIIPKETLTRALKAKKIYIIGGTAAISKDVEKQLAGKEIVRVDGKNRVETSEKVAKLVGNYDEAFIVNGNTGEADAISVSSVAAKNQAPILLTNGKTSTHSKKTGVEYYVVGGDAVVSDSIVSEFDAERISGSNRYETNRAVIKEFYPNKNKYYYTKGDLLVDALAVSPLSKDNGVVLVSPKSDNSILKDKDLVQVGGMDFEINLK